MDKAELQKSVQSLRAQLTMDRVPISKSGADLRRFVEDNQEGDPLVCPMEKKQNPWAEKSKCNLL